jgi:hypothetical protein
VHKDCKKNVVEDFKVMPQKSLGEINKEKLQLQKPVLSSDE